jgi:ArsR family metal-binding transcriptional regulator
MKDRSSEPREKLIQGFSLEMISPPCVPGAAYWSAQARLSVDIGDVLPYLNSRFPEAWYDHKARVLVMKQDGKKCAFRPGLISVAPVEDRSEALRLLKGLTDLVNETWRDRGSNTPSYRRKSPPTVMELYRRLPGTNCGRCGYPTCMAFAADLQAGKTDLSRCPQLSAERYARNREALQACLSA